MAIKKDTVQVRIEIDGQQSLTELNKLESQAAEIKGELKAGAKAAKEFESAAKKLGETDPGTKEYIKAAAAVEKTREAANKYYSDSKALDAVNSKIKELRKEVGLAGLSMRQLSARQRDLNREIQGITPGTEKYNALKNELIEVNTVLAKQRGELKGAANEAAGTGGKLFGILGKTGAALGIAGAALGAFSAVAGEISAIEKEYNSLSKTLQRVAPLTAQETAAAVASIQSLSAVFGKESGEVLAAANAFSKQSGITFSESLALIEKGFLTGADANGEFLDLLKEYPAQFKNAGFTAKEFIQIASQQVKSGIFSDKLLDTIKELDLSLKELTKAQFDALQPLGAAFVEKLAKGLAAGTTSTKEAFLAIQEQAAKVGLNIQQIQTITADVFKGAGEDAGGFANIVTNINEALALNIENLDVLGQAQKNALDTERLYNEALTETARLFEGSTASAANFFTTIKTAGVTAFNSLFKAIAKSGFLGQAGKLAIELDILKGRGAEQLNKDLKETETALQEIGKAQEIYNRLTKQGIIEKDKDKEEARQTRLNDLLEKKQFIETAILELKKDAASIPPEKEEIKAGEIKQPTKTPAGIAREKQDGKDRAKELEESEKQAAKILADWEALQKAITEIQQSNQDARLDSLGQEQKAINSNFEDLLNEAARIKDAALTQKNLTGEDIAAINAEFNAKEIAINAAHNEALRIFQEDKNRDYVEAKKAAQKEIQAASMDANAAEISAVNDHYDRLKEQAIKYGLDTAAIETARAKALKDIQEKANAETLQNDRELWAARAQVLTQFSSLVGETINFLGAVGVENSRFQKALTVAQIAIDTAASLSAIIPLAAQASAATGPAAPFVFAGYIAGMTATVLAGVGAAYKALAKSKEPSPPNVPAPEKIQGFFYGGYTGGGIGIKDDTGKKIAGVVHAREYVIPERLLKLAPVANMASIIEGLRTGNGFAQGGQTSPDINIVSGADSGLLEAVTGLNEAITALKTSGIKAYIVYSEIEAAQNTIDIIKDQTSL